MPLGQVNNSEMKAILDSEFQKSADPSFQARIYVSKYLGLGNLRGFWGPAMLMPNAGGVWITDMSGNGYPLTFAVSTPLVAQILGAFQWQFDGARYASRPGDDTQFDILGNEFWNVYPGISMGCWFYGDRVYPYAGTETLMAKLGAQMSYIFQRDGFASATGSLAFVISPDNINVYVWDHSKALLAGTWYFAAATYSPVANAGEPAGVRIWVNDQMEYHATTDRGSVGNPASIFNSNVPLTFGATSAATAIFQGWMTNWWIVGGYTLEADVFNLYETTKYLFGYVNNKGTAW